MVLVDKSIDIDKVKLPKAIVEILDKMEEYEKNNDDVSYVMALEDLEPTIKGFILANKLEKKYYDILMRKYGGF